MTALLPESELKWCARLNAIKQDLNLSDQELALRFGGSQPLINAIRAGRKKMPLLMKIKLLDQAAFASARDALTSLLPDKVANKLKELNDNLTKASIRTKLKKLPENVSTALMRGDELEGWAALLAELNSKYGTDKKAANAIGSTRSMIVVARSGASRLPPLLKLAVLEDLNYAVTDELLISLLQADGYQQLVHDEYLKSQALSKR